LRHKPIFWGTLKAAFWFLDYSRRVRSDSQRALEFLPFLPQEFSGIIDCARYLHNFPKTI